MNKKIAVVLLTVIILTGILSCKAGAVEFQLPDINLQINGSNPAEGEDLVLSLRILLLLTVLSLAPALLVMVTSFTRVIVVLGLIRQALATRRMPPNQVLIGLALFLTVFIMAPVWQDINEQALQPYLNNEITTQQAYDRGIKPIRDFMFKQTREKDLALFVNMTGIERPENRADIPTYVLIPAFVISELKTAFQIGFLIYLPFLMIDMVVASILMSMGMLMLPPIIISLPFKLLLFILVDGWYLVIESLVKTFY
ncbi:flagellar type III secretion system pore protein FliP [Halothermothrix orenii]|uniref:Flagellar biosynthetic protein FliP n=1 Tax=Halothermothrix orenii (strain H 168 / OCM 544 / DSM 9562) TaxID=373903 RepID=B8CYQ3_HALOH|nr:flagellar type III secretion system pore protein FliP [Halothermothrix orenii]ACL70422.1 flagellar biosynthetic protein FliP [Halothermothrix orenii H 168]